MTRNRLEINNELHLNRHHGGVILVHPRTAAPVALTSISSLFSSPIQCYFYDRHHQFCKVNQVMAAAHGLISEKDAIGKSIKHLITKDSAERIIANNDVVYQTQSMQIIEEAIQRKDGIALEGISIKYPCYDDLDNIIGIFGCSFVIDSFQSYAKSLALIAQTGLLNLPNVQMKKTDDSVYFSQREHGILYHLVRGKTAKEIAIVLGLSRRTVEHYLENLKLKTNSANKSELIDKIFGLFQ